jgi:uncharacterized protein YerC
MTNISKKHLKTEIYKKIRKQFFSTLGDLKDHSSEDFVEDFFSTSEEIMFYKRLAIILMLNKGIPPTAIRRSLKVSPDTIYKISRVLDGGGYKGIIKSFERNTKKANFEIDLEILLRAGMPPIVGKGRWKFLDDYLEKKRQK